ncbi:MAG TPA: FHA domain-containing protein [Pseudobdellovibrionaceae bacterium]|nr:FHA domain-containing protein [Pseudobdellovibrionaceae bacterium]
MSAAPSMNELLNFTLEVLKGPHAGEKFDFNKGTITIGREAENDVILSRDPRVSRQHVEIKQSLGQFYIVNLSQKNFVLLNGQNITSEKMESKAVLQVGDSEMRFTFHGGTQSLEPLVPAAVVTSLPKRPEMPVAPRPTGAPQIPANFQRPMMPPAGAYPPPGMPRGPFPGAPPRAAAPPSDSLISKMTSNPRFALFAVIGFIALSFAVSNLGTKSKKVENRAFRTEEELNVVREEAENEIKAFQEQKTRMNQQIFQKAYENFLRGYRDYRQGQFLRARESFQVVLNLDPDNELARRYLNLAKIRFDEMVKFHMLQGRRYLEKQNYRMCKASYQTVMTMLGNDPSNPEYKEALILHRQCSAALESRF